MTIFHLVCKHTKPYCSIGENTMIQGNGQSNDNPACISTETLQALSTVTELRHLVTAHISVSLNKETLTVSFLPEC